MKYVNYLLMPALLNLSASAWGLEALSDAQMSDVNAQAKFNFMMENVRYLGNEIPGEAEAGSVNTIAGDGSALLRKNYRFSADAMGSKDSPFTTEAIVRDMSVNTVSKGEVTVNGTALPSHSLLLVTLPEKAAWQNVDFQYDAYYENPSVVDTRNPNIVAGGTPSTEHTYFGQVSIDNLSVVGSVGIAGIPEGYKIESVYLDDGSRGAGSREGLLLDLKIDELLIEQWLFEIQNPDGVFDPERDIVLSNFRLANLHAKSATFEATEKGLRLAYHDPQPFTKDEGLILKSGGGHPDVTHPNYDPSFPKGELTFSAHVPHSLPNESRIRGVTLDHLVFNLRND